MMGNITDDIVVAYEGLIYKIIGKYSYFSFKDDLYQVAVIGLLNAYKNFNPNMNTKFSSYAYFYIDGEVKKFIRESSCFKVSKELIKLNSRIEKARDLLTNKFGRSISDEEISIFLNISYDELEQARLANYLVSSLDEENELTRNLYESVGETPKEYSADILDLKKEISKLDINDQILLYQRYENGYTQNEISSYLGLTQVQVSRKEKEILTRLRANLS